MADDVLSADEMEMLLAAGSARPAPAPPARLLSERAASVPPLEEKVRRALVALGEECTRRFSAELSALLRRGVRVELTAVSQVPCGEFAARLAQATCFSLLSASGADERWMLEIGPAVLYPMIDCMLGGGREPAPIADRPPTDIELRLARRVAGALVRQLQAVWHSVAELEFSIERVTTSPQVPSGAGEAIAWMRFGVELGRARGTLNLAIPGRWLSEVADRLTGKSDDASARVEQSATVELIACLAQTTIASDELRDLEVGDVIKTDQQTDAPLAVFADGVLRFRARAGALEGRKAVEIEAVVEEPHDGVGEAS